MAVKYKKYKNFLYYLYQPNKRDFKGWYEFYVDKDTDEPSYPIDSVMCFLFDGKTKRTKEQAEQDAKALIERYYTNPNVKELFDRLRE